MKSIHSYYCEPTWTFKNHACASAFKKPVWKLIILISSKEGNSVRERIYISYCFLPFESWTLWMSSLFKEVIRSDYFFFYKFIYLFLAALGLHCCAWVSLVAESGGYSSLRCTGFSLRWLLLLWSMGSRHAVFSSCGVWASVVVAHWL